MWRGFDEGWQSLVEQDVDSLLSTFKVPAAEADQALGPLAPLSAENDAEVAADGLAALHKSLARYPRLSPEQEQAVFKTMQQSVHRLVWLMVKEKQALTELTLLLDLILHRHSPLSLGLTTAQHRTLQTEFKHFLKSDEQTKKLKLFSRELARQCDAGGSGCAPLPDCQSLPDGWLAAIREIDWSFPLVVCLAQRQLPGGGDISPLAKALNVYLDAAGTRAQSGGGVPHSQRSQATAGDLQHALQEYFYCRNAVVNHNLRLVYHVSKKYADKPSNIEEVLQEGVFGLIRAAEKYRLEMGYRFSTYAYNWIEAKARLAPLREQGFMRLPTSVTADLSKLYAVAAVLKQQGLPVTSAAVARRCELSEGRIRNLLAINNRAQSIDQPVSADKDDLTLAGQLSVADHQVDEEVAQLELKTHIDAMLNMLDQRTAQILIRRFGLRGVPVQSLEQVSADIGLSRERVRQLEQQAVKALREQLAGTPFGEDLLSSLATGSV